MPGGINITVAGLDKVLKGFKSFGERKKKNIELIFKEGAEEIRNKALRRVPVDEGTLKNDIQIDRITEGYEVVVHNQYGIFQETGTKSHFRVDSEFASYVAQFKGQKVSTGDFYQNILEYVKRHKIKFEARGQVRSRRKRFLTDEQVAYIIMNAIRRDGIEGQPYLLNSFVEVRAKMIDKIIKELRA